MAVTGREARAERLNERLRGAQRTNVGDESFSLDIQGLEQPIPAPAPAPAVPTVESPNPAKRRRVSASASRSIEPASGDSIGSSGSTRRRSARKAARSSPYDLPSTSKESGVDRGVPPSDGALVPEQDEADLSVSRVIAALEIDPSEGADELNDAPAPASTSRSAQHGGDIDLGGLKTTGTSRNTSVPGALDRAPFDSSALRNEAGHKDAFKSQFSPMPESSPAMEKSKRLSTTTMSARSARTTRTAGRRSTLRDEHNDEDELSPDRPRDKALGPGGGNENQPAPRVTTAKAMTSSRISSGSSDDEMDELSPNSSKEEHRIQKTATTTGPGTRSRMSPTQSIEQEEAEDIDDNTAAAVIGQKRTQERSSKTPRTDRRISQGELEDELNDTLGPELSAAKKSKRGRPGSSPAAQTQPKAKAKTKPKPVTTRKPRTSPMAAKRLPAKPAPDKASSPGSRPRRHSNDEDNAAFEVTVQRFVNHKRRATKASAGDASDSEAGDGVDEDTDHLQLKIPFANRAAESPVDVFAQLCEEVIGNITTQFQKHLRNAPDAARKKEIRVKLRAVEAYREELNLRLLQHAIHLNNWYTLRKRVRQAHKEKITLRDEILRLRAEREQVALRMDAVRIKHEAETRESSFLLETSNMMRDVDQAVAEGRDAPELPPKAQKEAELANLELAVAQITDQVCASGGGGLLTQIQEFNSFLERAAVALESR